MNPYHELRRMVSNGSAGTLGRSLEKPTKVLSNSKPLAENDAPERFAYSQIAHSNHQHQVVQRHGSHSQSQYESQRSYFSGLNSSWEGSQSSLSQTQKGTPLKHAQSTHNLWNRKDSDDSSANNQPPAGDGFESMRTEASLCTLQSLLAQQKESNRLLRLQTEMLKRLFEDIDSKRCEPATSPAPMKTTPYRVFSPTKRQAEPLMPVATTKRQKMFTDDGEDDDDVFADL